AGGHRQAERGGGQASDRVLRMTGELFPLVVASVNPSLYAVLRRELEIRELDDPDAKELFVALEECFANDESGIDSLLARIRSRPLQSFIASRGASSEFKGDAGGKPAKLMEDGIKVIKKKRLKKRLSEIDAALRGGDRDSGFSETDELLAEKMLIDSQIRKLGGL
ncbi:MAG: DNA primase, partial [Spirochaetes bacterium]|nr:DNA primase [Spirochaetota bacterium]